MDSANDLRQYLEEWCSDAQAKVHTKVVIPRSGIDRRNNILCAPPYLTEEGMVMIDRRESGDRRGSEEQLGTL